MARMRNYQPWSGSPGVVETVVLFEAIRAAQAVNVQAAGATQGASSPVLIQQPAGFEVGASTLGVIRAAQALAVDALGNTSGGTYTPASEGGALIHFDMLDPTAYTLNGGSTGVTQIKNKISNVQWLFNQGADCPYEAAGINGHPCLHPTLVTHASISTEAAVVSALDCPNTAKPYTLIYVALPDSTTTGVATFGVGNSGVSSASTRVWGQRAAQTQYEYAQTTPATVGSGRTTAGTVSASLNYLAWVSPGTTLTCYLNNSALAITESTAGAVNPAYTPGTGPNRAALFCRPDIAPDSPAIQRFGELWLFDKALDAAALTRVYNYLTRWT